MGKGIGKTWQFSQRSLRCARRGLWKSEGVGISGSHTSRQQYLTLRVTPRTIGGIVALAKAIADRAVANGLILPSEANLTYMRALRDCRLARGGIGHIKWYVPCSEVSGA
ncbi:hypothetical protein [Bradyrhizobium sp. McL0616]|uniref:hypothetical protein n=1 Tax=Bradyrhizobium sp. McL0616 TaxID=3415674 RepID=UPI003CF99E4F